MSTTPKQLASNHRRRLKSMADKLAAMAEEWEDLDEYNRCMLQFSNQP